MNIFVDGSYSPQKKIGVGAYVIIDSNRLKSLTNHTIADLKIELSKDIVYHEFSDVNGSTDVEKQILTLALSDKTVQNQPITVYTDCHKTQSTDSYTDSYTVHHVKGHTKQINRQDTDKIFDVIDKATRKRLRKLVKNDLFIY